MPNSTLGPWFRVAGVAILLSSTAPTAQAQSGPLIIPSAPPGSRPVVLMAPDPAASCAGNHLAPVEATDIPPSLQGSTFTHARTGQRIDVAALTFNLDDRGRPRDIRPAEADGDGVTATLNNNLLLLTQAAFASWRFEPGARTGCRLTIRYTPVPVDQAEPPLLARYFAVTRTSGPARTAVENRLRGTDRACDEDRPARRAAWPAFDAGQPRPGVQDWTIVRFDVDAEGRPANISTFDSSGDEGFDAEARRSTGQLEVEPGTPSSGCLYNWFRRGDPLPAPPIPAPPTDLIAACPRAVLDTFRPGESANAAAPFRQRGVEGWALIRFDIAPWGAIGNVSVIEAQPASGVGDEALRVIRTGRAEPGEGGVRCVQPVIFRVPEHR